MKEIRHTILKVKCNIKQYLIYSVFIRRLLKYLFEMQTNHYNKKRNNFKIKIE